MFLYLIFRAFHLFVFVMIETEKVRTAAMLYLLSPCRGTDGYTATDMMVFAGIEKEFAVILQYQKAMQAEFLSLEQHMSKPVHQTDPKERLEHFKVIDKYIPELTIPNILRMIGCRNDDIFKKRGRQERVFDSLPELLQFS